jgi:RIO kinase 1
LQKHVNAGFISMSHTSGLRMDDKVANSVTESERKGALAKMRTSDKSDRATVEQALDPRTRMVLFKMISRRVLR